MSTKIKSKRRLPLVECVILSEDEYLWTFADWISMQFAKIKVSYAMDKYPDAVAVFVKDTTTGVVQFKFKINETKWSDWCTRRMCRVFQSWLDYARRIKNEIAYQRKRNQKEIKITPVQLTKDRYIMSLLIGKDTKYVVYYAHSVCIAKMRCTYLMRKHGAERACLENTKTKMKFYKDSQGVWETEQ